MSDTDVDPSDLARLYLAERDGLRRPAYLMTGQVHVTDEIVPAQEPPNGDTATTLDEETAAAERRQKQAEAEARQHAGLAITPPPGWGLQ